MVKLPAKKITREVIEDQVQYWSKYLIVWDRCNVLDSDDFDTKVFKLYIRLGRVDEVMTALKNSNEWPFSTETKHVTNILEKHCIDDKEIEYYGKELQKKNMMVNRRISN